MVNGLEQTGAKLNTPDRELYCLASTRANNNAVRQMTESPKYFFFKLVAHGIYPTANTLDFTCSSPYS